MSNREFHEQCSFYNWCIVYMDCPEFHGLRTIYAVPNGAHLAKGQGGKLDKEGRRKGIPDMHLPVARRGYHSLYIEMKAPEVRDHLTGKVLSKKGVLSADQKKMIPLLEEQGNHVAVCYGKNEAVAAILWYYDVNDEMELK